MAIGKFQITIDANQFVRGQSVSDYTNDGGLGASTTNINPKLIPGTIAQTASPTAQGTAVSDSIIASCENPSGSLSSPRGRLLLDKTGHYYSWAEASGVSLDKTATNTAGYINGLTDFAGYGNAAYATYCGHATTNDIVKYLPGSSLDETWWTATALEADGSTHPPALTQDAPHPLLSYNDFLFIGNARDINVYDGTHVFCTDSNPTPATVAPLRLAVNEQVYALGVEPSTGLIMVSIHAQRAGNTGGLTSANYIGLWDGFANTLRRKVPVNDIVTSFTTYEGQVIVGYGESLGIWNGSGVSLIRPLKNADRTVDNDLLWKHHLAVVDTTLYYVDGQAVMAYGYILPGQRVFWHMYETPSNATHLDSIAPLGSGGLGADMLGFSVSPSATATFKSFPTRLLGDTGGDATNIFTPNINFPRPVFIRRMRVFTTGVTSSGGTGLAAIVDENGTTHSPAVSKFVAATSKKVFDFDFSNLKLQMAQPKVTIDTVGFNLVRVILFYDVAE